MKIRYILMLLMSALSAPMMGQIHYNVDSILVAGVAEDSAGTDSIDAEEADTVDFDVVAPDLPWPQNVQESLNTLLDDKLFKTSQVAVMVWDLDADSAIFRHNELQRMRPASTEKVITAIAALDFLGADYKFRTELRYRGNVVDSTRTLHGDLICVGGMDPKFGSTDLAAFVKAVSEMGVDTIKGNLYVDLSFKDKDRLGAGWCWDDDNPPLTPLLLSRKDNFIDSFMQRIKVAGITVTGKTMETNRAFGGAPLLCLREHSIGEVVTRALKNSDNLYAEALFYQIAHKHNGPNAPAVAARKRIDMIIRKADTSASNVHAADGSGLSLYNYATAEMETMLLRYAYKNSAIYNVIYPALPIAGVDGTLRRRMHGTAAKGNVHAKTGTVTGVRALAGYCTASNGHRLCFAILNQGVKNGKDAHRFQDRVCNLLCR